MSSQRPDDELFSLLTPHRLTAVVDIGANPIDGAPPYKSMLQKNLCTVVGFEPQHEALATLNAQKGSQETYLPYAVGDGGVHVLNVCAASGMTSLFVPDDTALRHFKGFSEWGRIIRQESISTVRLDDIVEIKELDYLKIDAQGSELPVFRGGSQRLGGAVTVQTEVSFISLYKGQPTFGEIDSQLRTLGFVPHAFAAVNRRLILPLEASNPYAALNQLLEADIVYVRDFMRPENMSDEQLKHLALIAHHAYSSYDLSLKCILHLTERKVVPAEAMHRYLSLFKRLHGHQS